jgi:hypothetical protein
VWGKLAVPGMVGSAAVGAVVHLESVVASLCEIK